LFTTRTPATNLSEYTCKGMSKRSERSSPLRKRSCQCSRTFTRRSVEREMISLRAGERRISADAQVAEFPVSHLGKRFAELGALALLVAVAKIESKVVVIDDRPEFGNTHRAITVRGVP